VILSAVPPLMPDPRLIVNTEGDVKAEQNARAHAFATLRASLGVRTDDEALAALDLRRRR
jgi:hypothetical protein